jgi:hypothetical protein
MLKDAHRQTRKANVTDFEQTRCVSFWGFLSQIVAADVNLVKYLERKFKKQLINWLLTSSPKKKDPNNVSSARKVIDSIVWDEKKELYL